MANQLYPKYKEAVISGGANVNLAGLNVKAVLVDGADYSYSATHQYLSDVAAIGRVATSPNLSTKTVAAGSFSSANPTFSGVTGDQSEIVILYVDTGTPATSPLVAYFDTAVSGLPFTPNGGDLTIQVNAAGWFGL